MNDQTTIIAPTIGRKVWYWPSDYDKHLHLDTHPGFLHTAIEAFDDKQACDATVVYVHGDRCVNLQVVDHNGNVHKRCSVTLAQPGDAVPDAGGYAEWMPFQVGQAKAVQPAPVLTDDDAAADLAGTPRPDSAAANPVAAGQTAPAANDAQPEPPAAA